LANVFKLFVAYIFTTQKITLVHKISIINYWN